MGEITICIASWNIWAFGNRDYKGIARLIRENKIDVIGIQEATIYYKHFIKDELIPSYTSRGPNVNMAKEIAKQLGYYFVFFPSFGKRTEYIAGNAIISRFPLYNVRLYELNKKRKGFGNETRIMITSKIKVGGHILNFLNTHLGVSVRFTSMELRYLQVQKIISVLNKLGKNSVLTGDFNSVPANKEIKLLERKLLRIGGRRPTWPTVPFSYKDWHVGRLKYRVDNIFVSKNLKTRNFRVLKSKLSDHLPISTDIRLSS
ncbi:endonuclease/exonuclease/phosphatase family protein [Candidatus Marsarchaeota archaeon]|jgi:endonuclease/exonuclease/phosphatase family metal-dependent hydrolase|nr:endonuclease/exonuclease/phosphatase family protein [Candidatus Marsarchaeota archaeon]MCL5115479.1 endonuclease/exonuclease/phosphatase family protein [Candidatus Marsarchaeota archaeon]